MQLETILTGQDDGLDYRIRSKDCACTDEGVCRMRIWNHNMIWCGADEQASLQRDSCGEFLLSSHAKNSEMPRPLQPSGTPMLLGSGQARLVEATTLTS